MTVLQLVSDDWRTAAACYRAGPDLFFPLEDEDPRPALAFCETCPVTVECFAEHATDPDAVAGGYTAAQRAAILAGEPVPPAWTPPRSCEVCANPLPRSAHPVVKYCCEFCAASAAKTNAARWEANRRARIAASSFPCTGCNRTFRSQATLDSHACVSKLRPHLPAKPTDQSRLYTRVCDQCGTEFETRFHRARWCSTPCRRDARNEHLRTQRARRRDTKQVRDAASNDDQPGLFDLEDADS